MHRSTFRPNHKRGFGLAVCSFSFATLLSVTLLFGGTAAADEAFSLRDGDRVVLIGDGLIEQEQYFGWVEVMLTTAFPQADATFRNLGWNGDTPAGDSRFGLSLLQAGREPADEGWKQLQQQLELTRPTVAVLGYGMASALETAAETDAARRDESLKQFRADYERLIERLRAIDPQCRLVLLSPISPVGSSILTPERIAEYRDVIAGISERSGGRFIDLTEVAASPELRKDPVHLNAAGYRALALAIGDAFHIDRDDWQTSPVTERLRAVILEKNRLWFHRSRPANMAYVFGFRKHEQGQNAVEIPQFDPLIEAEEAKIAALRSLQDDGVEPSEPPTESKYAEFTPQPHPEFVVGEGLEISLWAENPMLNKPIQMNFDARGRLWVASSEAYPMIEVGQAKPDKVIVLEDTNGDGKADRSDVFADGLLIPTGVAPTGNGVYVAQSTDLLFLEDTDGDGRADRRERVLSGFGTEDTHHNLHTLLFGPDGRLYMNQSVYTRTDTETPHGVVRLKAGGGFRFDPRHRRMDIFFRGLWNPWGHQFDALGNSFMTDGAGFAGIAYVFPDAMFHPTPGAREQLDLISPGNYPKFCGGEIILGDSFPESWQGSMVTCDFRANRVTRFSISENGSGFVTNQEADLVRTSESTFRPIDVKQGPDGALYIADWSNPIINHGEVDFRDPRRDRWHGRIWRVTVKDRPLRAPADLTKASFETLVDHLFSGQRYLVDQARRVLIERGQETSQQLAAVLAKAESPQDRVIATQLSAAVGKPKLKWLSALSEHPDGTIRAAACRMLGDWSDPTNPAASVPRASAARTTSDRRASANSPGSDLRTAKTRWIGRDHVVASSARPAHRSLHRARPVLEPGRQRGFAGRRSAPRSRLERRRPTASTRIRAHADRAGQSHAVSWRVSVRTRDPPRWLRSLDRVDRQSRRTERARPVASAGDPRRIRQRCHGPCPACVGRCEAAAAVDAGVGNQTRGRLETAVVQRGPAGSGRRDRSGRCLAVAVPRAAVGRVGWRCESVGVQSRPIDCRVAVLRRSRCDQGAGGAGGRRRSGGDSGGERVGVGRLETGRGDQAVLRSDREDRQRTGIGGAVAGDAFGQRGTVLADRFVARRRHLRGGRPRGGSRRR